MKFTTERSNSTPAWANSPCSRLLSMRTGKATLCAKIADAVADGFGHDEGVALVQRLHDVFEEPVVHMEPEAVPAFQRIVLRGEVFGAVVVVVVEAAEVFPGGRHSARRFQLRLAATRRERFPDGRAQPVPQARTRSARLLASLGLFFCSSALAFTRSMSSCGEFLVRMSRN